MLKSANQVRVHIELSRFMLKNKSGVTIRAYAAWTALRTMDRPHFGRGEVIEFLIEQTGRTRQTVQSWIKAGIKAGFFLAGRKGRISLVGKLAIFEKFLPNSKPGSVVLVDTDDLLTGKLQTVRAVLYGSQFAVKTIWISREKLHEISGPVKRTQLRYDKINAQPKRYSFSINFAEAIQRPNLYSRAARYFTPQKSGNVEKFGLHASNQETGESGSLSGSRPGRSLDQSITSRISDFAGRVLFAERDKAQKAAKRRHKKGLASDTFSFIEPEKMTRPARRFGHVFLEMHVGEYMAA